MKQIRKGVFETNSSSTHSITLHGLEDKMILPHEKSNIEVSFGEYGWEQEQYRGYQYRDKLSYVLTLIQYHLPYSYDSEEMGKNIVNTILSSNWYKWLSEMVYDYCKKTISVDTDNEDSWSPAGYVDHQSTDILDDWWVDDEQKFKENMKQFIFNEKYGFVTDNDNH